MSTVERHEYVRLLDRIIAAAEAGDPSDLANVYWPDAVIWHNDETARKRCSRALLHRLIS